MEVCEDWGVDVDRGPDWLFVKIHPGKEYPGDMGDKLWKLADRHFVYRLVLEMDEIDQIPSQLMGELVMLQKRILQRDGVLRLCGLSPRCAEALQFCRLDQTLPNYESREDAILGQRQRRWN